MSIRKRRIRLLRIVFFVFAPLALFVGDSWGDASVIDYAVEGAGYVFLMAGLGLRMWSILYIGRRKSEELVTEGPYSLCRNPLYVGTVLIAVGASLCFANLAMLVFTLGVLVPVHLAVVRGEEKRLEELFGPSYAEYRARTPAFNLLNWRRYRSPDQIVVSAWAIRRATVDALAVLCIPPLAHLVDTLQDAKILRVFLKLP